MKDNKVRLYVKDTYHRNQIILALVNAGFSVTIEGKDDQMGIIPYIVFDPN